MPHKFLKLEDWVHEILFKSFHMLKHFHVFALLCFYQQNREEGYYITSITKFYLTILAFAPLNSSEAAS